MPDHDSVWQSGEDVQRVENVLVDSDVAPETRRFLLGRASAGLLGAGGLASVLAGCGSSHHSNAGAAASGTSSTGSTTSSTSASSASEIQTTIDTAATAEALAVTYLTAVIKQAAGTPLARFADILKAANAEEYDHYKALKSLGAKPVATRFWVPNDFFGHKLSGVLPTLHLAETLFVNAYLIAITQFAKAGKASLARYASEISGTEAQHLVLVNYAAGKTPPNDLGFTDYLITSIPGIVRALEGVGIGFGKKGSKPGSFASFAPPPASAVVKVNHTMPA